MLSPAAFAAFIAWTSPRRAYMPPMPIGERTMGMAIFWPNSSVSSEIFDTSRMTRWRRARASKSSTFRRRVASA